jgi:galactose mutarotase-like enzyme
MDTHITQSEWLGQPAYSIETTGLRLITVPGMGAKIVSIFDKQVGREWLLPPVNRPFVPVDYGVVFTDQDMSGWDEMFPTINACAYPDGSYAGALLPDHGEVWPLAWGVEAADSSALRLSVNGVALPYRFTRTIRPLNAHTMRLDFEVVNTGTEEFDGFWTGHPQFKIDTDTRIVFPSEVKSVIMVQETPDWAADGTEYAWPVAVNRHGQSVALDRAQPPDQHKYHKFYLPPDQHIDWVVLRQESHGHWLRLSWNPEQVPYLGVWVDEGGINSVSTIALEPSTGYYDDLSVAWKNQRVMHLMPQILLRWHLDVACGTGD